ncbi:MAG: heme-copper oxidase subunit III [bacterium]
MSAATSAVSEHQATHTVPGRMGIWWFLASEIMIFGGFIAIYLLYRMASEGAWSVMAEHVSAPIGTFNTVILLTSSLTMVKAFEFIDSENRKKTRNFLLITVILGLAFLGVKGFEYSREISMGYTPVSGMFWSFYYAMTGLHGLHVLVGIIANFSLYIMAVRGTLWPKTQRRVEYAGLYWHFVDVIWLFLFPLLYLSY